MRTSQSDLPAISGPTTIMTDTIIMTTTIMATIMMVTGTIGIEIKNVWRCGTFPHRRRPLLPMGHTAAAALPPGIVCIE
jgi:hypothetical protein